MNRSRGSLTRVRRSSIPTVSAKRLPFALSGWLWLAGAVSTPAQDVEPRRWTHLPAGLNVVGVTYVYTDGQIGFDPVLRIENAEVESNQADLSYLRSMDWFGKTARIDVRVPFLQTRWVGLLDGEPAAARREGFGDPRVRVSVNLVGAPALRGRAFLEYRSKHKTSTTVGAALAVRLPVGEYSEDRLLNLGWNRYTVRPQLGVLHTRGQWSFELTGSVFFYTDNQQFVGGNEREQDPVYAAQVHVVRVFGPRLWLSVGLGYGQGGRSTLSGDRKDDHRSDMLLGIAAGFPIGRSQSLTAAYVSRRRGQEIGLDANLLALGWSIRF